MAKQDTGKKRDTKDQFYTKREVAGDCVKRILELYPWTLTNTLWIEPSAGAGAFLSHFSGETIALDIDPKKPGILQADFLQWSSPLSSSPAASTASASASSASQQKKIIFGNPPFGRQGSLAKKFLKHSASQGAALIAFILPRSFSKPSMFNSIPLEYHLTHSHDLPTNSFEVNGEDYDVPCIFQIWEKRAERRQTEEEILPEGFTYVKATDDYDLAFRRVGVAAGTCHLKSALKPSPQSHHFLKLSAGRDNQTLQDLQKKINAHTFPSNTVGPRSLSKSEINSVINRLMANPTT